MSAEANADVYRSTLGVSPTLEPVSEREGSIPRRSFLTGCGALAGLLSKPGFALAESLGSSDTREPASWWKTAVIYQIYPRSFQDSNGDGMGDFPGMTSRLHHLRDLGVDAVWVTACFDSPNADNGYDVRDYRRIDPAFGTMTDFDRFMAEANRLDIKVILDMVFNHSSDEHEWFKQSRSSRVNPYRDFYIWRDPVNGGPPNNWTSAFGGPSWTLDQTTGQYYLHHYAAKQPDLNWENPKVRKELFAVLAFWAEKGVSGFRFDCVGEFSKPQGLRNATPAELQDQVIDFRTTGPHLDEYFKEMRKATKGYPNLYFAGEGWGMSRESIVRALDDRNSELDTAFRFDFVLSAAGKDWRIEQWSLTTLRAFVQENQFTDDPHVWPIFLLEDHDFARSLTRFGSGRPEFRNRSAALLAMLLLTQRGTPLIYQGEEIGMTNFPFTSISQFDDIGVHNEWRDLVETGKVPAQQYLTFNAFTSRDNSRTPMQWNSETQAGFTSSAKPWLAVNPNYVEINVEKQRNDPDSVMSFYRKMLRLRKDRPVLTFGSYRDISGDHPKVYAYVRKDRSDEAVVILNFSDEPSPFVLPAELRAKKVILANTAITVASEHLNLPPWAALLLG